MKTIVVALSRSDCAGEVLTEALALARNEPARYVLLHVVEPLTSASDPREALITSARHWLTPFVTRATHTVHRVVVRVEYGNIVETILDVVQEQRAAHLVVGSRMRRGIALLLLGSTAQEVSRRASCPVRLVRHTWKSSCAASSCGWCEDNVDPLRARLTADGEG